MQINLLWPAWARVVERFKVSEIQARGLECWHSVKRAAALLVERQEREHKARFYREEMPASAELRAHRWGRLGLLLLLPFLAGAPVHAEEPEQESKLFRALGFAVYATSAGDALSTELALAQDGVYEFNPINQTRGGRIATHIGAPIVVNATSAELYKRGKKKRALWMRIAFVAAYGTFTAYNVRQATR